MLAALTILVAGACGSLKELLRFDINFSRSFTIPKGGVPGITWQNSVEIPVDESTFENKGTVLSNVKEIRADAIKFTIVNPTSQTFRFLESINVYISSADGLNEQKLAFKSPVDPNIGNVLELETNKDLMLDQYFKADKFRLRLEGRLRRAVEQNLDTKADFTFSVVADPL